MNRVLLISMPFVSVRYPSPALSLLKSILQENGVQCDVAYLNVIFQAYIGRPEVYEAIADFLIVGETVFGPELFGDQWARSDRGNLSQLDAPLLPAGTARVSIRDTLLHLRAMAGPFLQMCLSRINWDHYDIVGFTSVYSQQVASLALARHIKERFPDKVIAFGGANCEEEMGRALLRLFPFIDWVFNGEGDVSFPLAVTRRLHERKQPENIPGVSYRCNGQIVTQDRGQSPDLEALPYPDFDEYFKVLKKWAPDYLSVASLSLELSRGCWWGKKSQCIFCGLNCRNLDYRRKSAKRAETEIKTLTGRYGIDRVILTDLVLDMSAFKTFLPALAEWGGLEELFLEARAGLSPDQLRMLKAAGVKGLQPGIESLDSEVLTLMHKGTTLLQNIQFLKWSRELDIFPTWNLLYGFPGESSAAYRRMADLIPVILHLHPPMDVSPMLLVRFSPLFEHSRHWGLTNVRAHDGYRSVYPFDQEDLNDLAYFFDYDREGRHSVSAYIGPLKERVDAWKLCWEQPQPPSLTYRQLSGLQLAVVDTRPGQRRQQVVLQDDTALAYALCEAVQLFDTLASSIRSRMGDNYVGDAALRQRLEQLVADGYMLSEDDRFLSLAVKPGQAAEASEEW